MKAVDQSVVGQLLSEYSKELSLSLVSQAKVRFDDGMIFIAPNNAKSCSIEISADPWTFDICLDNEYSFELFTKPKRFKSDMEKLSRIVSAVINGELNIELYEGNKAYRVVVPDIYTGSVNVFFRRLKKQIKIMTYEPY